MGNKTCDLMKSGKTVLFAFEEAIGSVCCAFSVVLNSTYGQSLHQHS